MSICIFIETTVATLFNTVTHRTQSYTANTHYHSVWYGELYSVDILTKSIYVLLLDGLLKSSARRHTNVGASKTATLDDKPHTVNNV